MQWGGVGNNLHAMGDTQCYYMLALGAEIQYILPEGLFTIE